MKVRMVLAILNGRFIHGISTHEVPDVEKNFYRGRMTMCGGSEEARAGTSYIDQVKSCQESELVELMNRDSTSYLIAKEGDYLMHLSYL
jgi:hypothetical protein